MLKPVRVLLTVVFVLLAWVMFRASTIAVGGELMHVLLHPSFDLRGITDLFRELKAGLTLFTLVLTLLFVVSEPFLDRFARGERHMASSWLTYGFFGLLLAVILIFGEFGRVTFIYFQF